MSLVQVCGRFQRALMLNPIRRSQSIGGVLVVDPSARESSRQLPPSTQASSSLTISSTRSLSSSPQNRYEPYITDGIRPRLRAEKNPLKEDFSKMTNEELADTSTIPGWDLIHSPPGKMPRGCLVGTVVSTKMQKTVNVAVDRYRIVPKVRKRMKYTRKFMAHDEDERANLGDLVMIEPCHKISKRKHFMVKSVVKPKGRLL